MTAKIAKKIWFPTILLIAIPALAEPVSHPAGGYVNVNGARLWYESEGQGEALVLVAGGPGESHDTFHPYFSSLASHYRIIYFDAFGRGKSDRAAKTSEYTFDRDIEDLEGLRKSLNLGKITVFGHSYGGVLAQGYALKYPHSVRSLILCNTFVDGEDLAEIAVTREKILQDYFPEKWDQFVAVKKQPASAARDAKLEGLRDSVPGGMMFDYDPANNAVFDSKGGSFNTDVSTAMFGSLMKLDFRQRLGTLKCPILILAGRSDRLALPRLTRHFQSAAPKAKFVMFEKSGHDIFLEENARFLEVVTPFLEER